MTLSMFALDDGTSVSFQAIMETGGYATVQPNE